MNTAKTPNAAPAHIVHFGAGICNELDNYLQSGAKKITLVEADPSICKRLGQRAKDHQQLQVVQAAVAATTAEASLFVYNLPAANSLRKATGLYDIYPGLKLKTEIPLITTSPEELLQPLELDSQQSNWLTIDAPGEELSILEAMHDAGQLDYFSLLNVYCGTGSLYQDCADAPTLLQQLQGWGYEVLSQDNQSDPDRPCWSLQRNPLFPELAVARERLSELEKHIEAANKTEAELKQRLNTVEKQQDEYHQQIETVNQELAESRQAASNSAKLLKLKENDLKELQQRYKQSIKAQEQQHQLLMQIGERLQLASKYLHDVEGMPAKGIQEQHQKKNNDKTTAKTKPSGKTKGKP